MEIQMHGAVTQKPGPWSPVTTEGKGQVTQWAPNTIEKGAKSVQPFH